MPAPSLPVTLVPDPVAADLTVETAAAPLPGTTWYTAAKVGAGLAYALPPGALADAKWLTADLLLDGHVTAVFQLTLQEGGQGPAFHCTFMLLNQCQARLRLPLAALDQNRWQLPREGALLKPLCGGARIDPAKVERMTFTLLRLGDDPVRWCMSPFTASATQPPILTDPVLPQGKLLDELGQSTLRDWPGKSRSAADVTQRLQQQLADAPSQKWPGSFSRWGGWTGLRLEATGFFRCQEANGRWWLVDPDGYAFWSAGIDCVNLNVSANIAQLDRAIPPAPPEGEPAAPAPRPGESRFRNYLDLNFRRAFGPGQAWRNWATITLGELRRLGFNTIGNWSDAQIAREAKFPYVRPLDGNRLPTAKVFRDFPDVFAPSFEQDAAAFAQPLREAPADPALIGYFLMNEPTWGFAAQTPAAGMLFSTPTCHSRQQLAQYLGEKHGGDAGLAQAWRMPVTRAQVAAGPWTARLTKEAEADLAGFSSIMVDLFFGVLSQACKKADPHHLNLGIRYYTTPPAWALEGMKHFDVFSMNAYTDKVPAASMARIYQKLGRPLLVGEWHHGALDVGLPASGIGRVASQADRGKAYRVYLEDAAAKPWCVGVHYFQWYDQSALGRFDGENYNIGFLDVCHRPYAELAAAARASHERLYAVATGQAAPYAEAPRYLSKLFC